MPDDLTKRGPQDRRLINMHEEHEVRGWTNTLRVTKDELQRLVDKVGNSAAAVRQELERQQLEKVVRDELK